MIHFFYKKAPVVLDQHIRSEKLCAFATGKASKQEIAIIAGHVEKCHYCHIVLSVTMIKR